METPTQNMQHAMEQQFVNDNAEIMIHASFQSICCHAGGTQNSCSLILGWPQHLASQLMLLLLLLSQALLFKKMQNQVIAHEAEIVEKGKLCLVPKLEHSANVIAKKVVGK